MTRIESYFRNLGKPLHLTQAQIDAYQHGRKTVHRLALETGRSESWVRCELRERMKEQVSVPQEVN